MSDPFVDPYMPAAPVPLVWNATPVKVYRYTPAGTVKLTQLPNVLPVDAAKAEGNDPGRARFRYDLTYPDARAPKTVEEAIDTAGTKEWAVKEADRLVIKATRPDGTSECLFDGLVLKFRIGLDARGEYVQIEAVGIAKRWFDTPLLGAYVRNAHNPKNDDDEETDIVAQFNPKGVGNATPEDGDAEQTEVEGKDYKFPTFIDPKLKDDEQVRRKWTLPMAVRYILYKRKVAEGMGWVDDEWNEMELPDGPELDNLLVAKLPYGDNPFDPEDPGTYSTKDIIVPDTPITGRDKPTVLCELIRDYGFGMRFRLKTDPATGEPKTALELFHQHTGATKPILIQARGSNLDRAKSTCQSADVMRSLEDVANEWWVEGALKRYEVSFILIPGFPSDPADAASTAAIDNFDKSSPNYNANSDKYRLFIFNECGQDAVYDPGSGTALSTNPPNLDDLFGANTYVERYRKPIAELLTRDDKNKPRKARLSISKNYTGGGPGLWDGSGTWQPVEGGYELLKDRIGVRIHNDNPNKWKIGDTKQAGAPYPLGVVRAVEELAKGGKFWLRLTVVVEGDQAVRGKAERRSASPVPYRVRRVVDARDRYKYEAKAKYSEFNNTADPVVVRDDTPAAEAEAAAVRSTTEAGVLDGEFVIGHVTTAYELGDRLEKIQGRETPLRTDSGQPGENPILPVVVGVRWEFMPEQRTYLRATDAGTDRSQYRRQIHNRKVKV